MVKYPPVMQETERREFDPWVGKIPWRRAWQPTPVFLPGESPWTGEPDGLQAMRLQRWTQLSNKAHDDDDGVSLLSFLSFIF